MPDYEDDHWAKTALTKESPIIIKGWWRQYRAWLFLKGEAWYVLLETQEPHWGLRLELVSVEEASVLVSKMRHVELVSQVKT